MPRSFRVVEGFKGLVENLLYALGDAEDFIARERPNFCEYVDAVAYGKMSATEAKRHINEAFANAQKQLDELRVLAAHDARHGGYTQLHPSLLEAMAEPTTAPIRLIAVLPTREGA